jgi:uncharacterized coiled-coil DUF342 family protein
LTIELLTIRSLSTLQIMTNKSKSAADMKNSADTLKAKALEATTVAEGITISKQFGVLLTEISDLQKYVGKLRKESNSTIGKIRQANAPKGSPKEGATKEIDGKTYVFASGSFYPYKSDIDQTVK